MSILFRVSAVASLLTPLAVGHGAVGASVFSSGGAEFPLARVDIISPTVFREAARGVYIEAASGVALSKLVGLSVFGPFRPGLTIEEATVRFGSPVQTRSERGKDIAVYDSLAARIELVDELSGSGCVSYRRRTLYAYPKSSAGRCGARVADVFDASLAGHIAERGTVEVGVAEAGNGERVWGLIRDGCVEGLSWWTPASQASR